MSTAASNHRPDRHLHLAGSSDRAGATSAPSPAREAWTVARPPLLRLCGGEPLLLDDAEVDLVALVNQAPQIAAWLLDDDADPDDYRLAEVLVEYLCHRFGIQRRGKGDRFKDLESIYRRHLLPFLIELDASLPAQHRGVAAKRLRHLQRLPAILAGDEPLPAATVAGDLLNRRGIACIYLDIDLAARVVAGGARALEVALQEGRVTLRKDVRTGQDIVLAADLRTTGLLIERTAPHGCATSTATKVLSDLKNAIDRARDHGAAVRGRFRLVATEPLPGNRMRLPRARAGYVSLSDIATTAPHLPPIGQVVLWLERLTGLRISENYGPRVSDYERDTTSQAWLRIDKQGGLSSLGRDVESGQYIRQDGKDHTKTEAGVRTIPLPAQLAALLDLLIAIFHTDAETGEIDRQARLIPGIQSENTSGQSSFRTWLGKAHEQAGTSFRPHALRAGLITDLKDAGIEERLAHFYAGHEQPNRTIQDEHYDSGPDPRLLLPIAGLLEQRLRDELRLDDLRLPTSAQEQWGSGTRRYRQRDWIEQQLVNASWRCAEPDTTGRGPVLSTRQVATRIGKSESRARTLMARGEIVATRKLAGDREVWVAREADVHRYLDELVGSSLTELAAEAGCDYHQTWQLAGDLGLLDDDRRPATKVRLSPAAGARLLTEVERRSTVLSQAMTVREAAEELKMAVTVVETLIRRGYLEVVDGTTGARRRYVSRTSVEAYLAAHPIPTEGAPTGNDHLLTCTQTRRLAGITRPQLTTLITTRQVRTGSKPGSPHVYVTASSLSSWAERTGRPAVAEAVRRLSCAS